MNFFLQFIFIVASLAFIAAQQCDVSSNVARFDCYPDNGASQGGCESRQCCWRLPSANENLTDVNVPYCYYSKSFPTYQLVSNQTTDFGYRFRLTKSQKTYLPNDILDLTADLIFETQQRLRIRIYDSQSKRFEVPITVPNVTTRALTTDYDVQVQPMPFGLVVKRKSTGMVIFDSTISPLIFADQFIKISTRLSSPLVYGLGEHKQGLLIDVTNTWKRLSFWARDVPPSPDTNLYGVHPFHLNVEQNPNNQNTFHGQFLLNSNAMDIDLQPLPALSYTTVGGIIDLYLFTGPSASDVIQQYWDVIGKPMLPPYWSLGFHLCRWGYNNLDGLRAVYERMKAAEFPYDAQWTDIDTMDNHRDYTYDQQNFQGFGDFVRYLQTNSIHYVNIIDPAISSTQPSGSYPPYDEGLRRKVFITKYNSQDPLIGTVWPGQTAFPDFTNPETTEWWTDIAGSYHDIVPFDGMWIDMNEPSSFVDGSTDGCTSNNLDNPPYVPHILGGSLASKTICASAQQYLSSHYNLHSMYGYFESIASNNAMKAIRQKRPFILSRSSFAGSGQYAAHWTGDNSANYDDLYSSIPTIIGFNMFGITHVGADICGFQSDTTEELCTRWMQLGAFYPFMRNHNTIGAKDQDPAAFSPDAQKNMKQALIMRYTLAPFWYTLHYLASTESKTIVQPLVFEYSDDATTFGIDQQFLVGRALLVSPNLIQGSTSVHAYFPMDTWYEFPSGVQMNNVGQYVDLPAPLSTINVHVRGGFILPLQAPGANLVLGRQNAFSLLVARSQNGYANGSLYWDDGDSIDSLSAQKFNYFKFQLTSTNILTINGTVINYKDSPMSLNMVKVLGVSNKVISVTINGQSYSQFLYNQVDSILIIYGLNLDLLSQPTQIISWTTS